jgi:hypothetical protein
LKIGVLSSDTFCKASVVFDWWHCHRKKKTITCRTLQSCCHVGHGHIAVFFFFFVLDPVIDGSAVYPADNFVNVHNSFRLLQDCLNHPKAA